MIRRMLTLFSILVVVVSAFAFTGGNAHANAQSTCSSTKWVIDTEDYIPNYHGKNSAGNTVLYTWDIQILSFRDSSSNAYCGKISDHLCLTTPTSGIGWPTIGIDNQWYLNNNYVNSKTDYFSVPNTRSVTVCSYSGSFVVPRGGNVIVIANMATLDGPNNAGTWTVFDSNVQ